MTFEEWRLTQISSMSKWPDKYSNKSKSAKQEGNLNKLTFDEYLFKAYEAGINNPDQISINGFHLSRLGDIGDYTVESCRFLWYLDNLKEKNTSFMIGNNYAIGQTSTQGEKHGRAKLTSEQVIKIWYSTRLYNEIADEYNVSCSTIYNIKNKFRWSSVTNKLV